MRLIFMAFNIEHIKLYPAEFAISVPRACFLQILHAKLWRTKNCIYINFLILMKFILFSTGINLNEWKRAFIYSFMILKYTYFTFELQIFTSNWLSHYYRDIFLNFVNRMRNTFANNDWYLRNCLYLYVCILRYCNNEKAV